MIGCRCHVTAPSCFCFDNQRKVNLQSTGSYYWTLSYTERTNLNIIQLAEHTEFCDYCDEMCILAREA